MNDLPKNLMAEWQTFAESFRQTFQGPGNSDYMTFTVQTMVGLKIPK
jgi:hypothetical protein